MILLPATRPDPVQVKVSALDSKMNAILENKSLTTHQKMLKYFETLKESIDHERGINNEQKTNSSDVQVPLPIIKKEETQTLDNLKEEDIDVEEEAGVSQNAIDFLKNKISGFFTPSKKSITESERDGSTKNSSALSSLTTTPIVTSSKKQKTQNSRISKEVQSSNILGSLIGTNKTGGYNIFKSKAVSSKNSPSDV